RHRARRVEPGGQNRPQPVPAVLPRRDERRAAVRPGLQLVSHDAVLSDERTARPIHVSSLVDTWIVDKWIDIGISTWYPCVYARDHGKPGGQLRADPAARRQTSAGLPDHQHRRLPTAGRGTRHGKHLATRRHQGMGATKRTEAEPPRPLPRPPPGRPRPRRDHGAKRALTSVA